jgi:hypothetical protein
MKNPMRFCGCSLIASWIAVASYSLTWEHSLFFVYYIIFSLVPLPLPLLLIRFFCSSTASMMFTFHLHYPELCILSLLFCLPPFPFSFDVCFISFSICSFELFTTAHLVHDSQFYFLNINESKFGLKLMLH